MILTTLVAIGNIKTMDQFDNWIPQNTSEISQEPKFIWQKKVLGWLIDRRINQITYCDKLFQETKTNYSFKSLSGDNSIENQKKIKSFHGLCEQFVKTGDPVLYDKIKYLASTDVCLRVQLHDILSAKILKYPSEKIGFHKIWNGMTTRYDRYGSTYSLYDLAIKKYSEFLGLSVSGFFTQDYLKAYEICKKLDELEKTPFVGKITKNAKSCKKRGQKSICPE